MFIPQDVEFPGLTETITWNTEGVPSGSGLTFCVYPFKVNKGIQATGHIAMAAGMHTQGLVRVTG